MTNLKTNPKFYYAIPLGVLRRFLEQNKDEKDNFIQLFELDPRHIFSEQEIKAQGDIKERGTVIIGGENMPRHKE